jgi:hypothetical protein
LASAQRQRGIQGGERFAVIALAAVALMSSFWLLLDVVRGYSDLSRTFGVASFEDRFQALRKALPSHSVVGYASDNPTNDASAIAEFYLTQYALAPTIVTSSLKESMVVVNYHTPQFDPAKLRAQHLTLIQNFGNGVLLCRNDAQ